MLYFWICYPHEFVSHIWLGVILARVEIVVEFFFSFFENDGDWTRRVENLTKVRACYAGFDQCLEEG